MLIYFEMKQSFLNWLLKRRYKEWSWSNFCRKSMEKPITTTDLQSFIGLLQFLLSFIKNFSQLFVPLTNLTIKDNGI